MKLLEIYSWLAGTKNDFINSFRNDDSLYNLAITFWDKLDNGSIGFIITMLVIGIALAYYYYGPFNNKPGRKYTPKWWGIMCGVAIGLTSIVTLILEYFIAKPNMQGAWSVEIKVALCNAIYAGVIYFLTSVVVCQCNIKTNAYKLFKKSEQR